MKMRMKRVLLIAAVLFLVAASAVAVSLASPYRGFSGKEVFVDIPKGAGTSGMARMLEQQRIIRFQWQFLAVRALRPHAALQAGEYRFAGAASVWDIYKRIASGDVFYYELVIPEGNNLFDISRAVGELGFLPPEKFLAAAHDISLIRDLAPDVPSLEGFLFPSTYRITRHTSAGEICRMMTGQFRRVWAGLNGSDAQATVTLASLVEKETAVAAERPLVASVYRNRLRLGMPLQCDPTTIYAALLESRYRGKIFRSDLASENAYNTYVHAGLPPGPIANPGRSSLEAALHPADTGYLYFVAKADGSGAHTFSTTLAGHERAVKEYRRGIRKQARAAVR